MKRRPISLRWGVSAGLSGMVILVWGVASFRYGRANERDASLPPSDSVTLTVAGTRTTIFESSTEGCGPNDRPDVYAHAVRTPTGLMLISGNAFGNYTLTGPDFDHLRRDCAHPRLVSGDNPDPSAFRGREWINAVYRLGDTIHALVHDEYHDPVSPLCMPGENGPRNPCWFNTVTYAYSIDGGLTFSHGSSPRGFVVAPPTSRWDPRRGAPEGTRSRMYGYFGPSNIIRGPDSYFYATMVVMNNPDSARGTCAIRTRDLGDPLSWRAWDGAGYGLRFENPYNPSAPQPLRACAAVSPGAIHDFGGSLTYNTYLGRYVLVGFATPPYRNPPIVCGFAFSLSKDLVTWTPPQVFASTNPPPGAPRCPQRGDLGNAYYPSLVDPSDTTVNFEVTGRTPHLYYVAGFGSPKRSLIRVQVRFDRHVAGVPDSGR